MFSEHFRLIIHSQSFPISKKTIKFDIYFPSDCEHFTDVPDVFSIITDVMPIEFRMKICLFCEQSKKQTAKWDHGFTLHNSVVRCIGSDTPTTPTS